MSEYTNYIILKVEDLGATKEKFDSREITSVLEVGPGHPLGSERGDILEKYSQLEDKYKWLILLAQDTVISEIDFLSEYIELLIDEDMRRWRIDFSKDGKRLELLFSDQPWGDYSDIDPEKDLARIEKAKNLTEDDLVFIEEVLKVPRTEFREYLAMGTDNVFDFCSATNLPMMEMLTPNAITLGPQHQNRCTLWTELRG